MGAAKCFQTSPEISTQCSSQNYVGDLWNFELLIVNDIFTIVNDIFRKNSDSPL